MNTDFLRLIPSIFTILYATYGTWFLIIEIFCSIVPFTIIFTCLIALAIHFCSIPPPGDNAAEAVLGKEPHLENEAADYVMRTVAHRGAGLDAPENSLEAFRLCNEKGCNAIEFDVTLTKDGIPIVFHDKTLERMADMNVVISQTAWEDLQNIDISVKHPYKDRFTNTNIPTLDQAVAQMLACGQRMFIDIKDNNTKMVKVILDLFTNNPDLISRAAVTSFFPNIIYLVRRGNPKIVCCLAWRPNVFAYHSYKYPEGKGERRANMWYKHFWLCFCDILNYWALSRLTYYILGLSVILLHKDALSGEAILNWRKKGVRVIAWSVNSPTEKQHIARNLKITYLTDTLTGESTAHTIPS
ncbi:glycerophosphodiester phosphodiesterase 1 [Anoplophora glabripennis]|uniref:Glycerophosphodiester phosphodiesterase n=1 Tax=Anoplophora glabripennis TaxID=217634 RepID=V5GN05_ANOGL|nr:glycerophosphodiester phosphodiesterase 1 [Anoplophora glabripennis]